ncbi:MAG: L,D-transpeptidase family protein [bacterium]|nr:L,D-transpeptidase family protein [bacterium]
MHVHISYHRKVVGILSGVVLVLLVLLVMALFKVGLFHTKEYRYLKGEEAVLIEGKDGQDDKVLPVEKVLFEYIEVADSCSSDFQGECLNARSGPGEDFPKILKLRKGIVLKVGGKVERDGQGWYKVIFDEWLRYPERLTTDFYVSADYVKVLLDEGLRDLTSPAIASAKQIIVDRSEQMLYAYDGKELFMKQSISTGLELTPTPRGTFTIYRKTPSRYMQGPIPEISQKFYDLPGVPWNLYFTYDGAVIHGTYWHQNFGKQSSNGCVNLPPEKAHELYTWADLGTRVIVQD